MSASETVKIYHNPRCSKSRETLQILRDAGHGVEIIEYLKDPPSAARLVELLNAMGLSARDVIRKKESVYRDLGLDDPSVSDDDLIAQMVAHPILIERPIVVARSGARIGRPPESVLELFV